MHEGVLTISRLGRITPRAETNVAANDVERTMNLIPKNLIDTHRYGGERPLADRACMSFGHVGNGAQRLGDLKDLQPR
jgi:hypothetical protein